MTAFATILSWVAEHRHDVGGIVSVIAVSVIAVSAIGSGVYR